MTANEATESYCVKIKQILGGTQFSSLDALFTPAIVDLRQIIYTKSSDLKLSIYSYFHQDTYCHRKGIDEDRQSRQLYILAH